MFQFDRPCFRNVCYSFLILIQLVDQGNTAKVVFATGFAKSPYFVMNVIAQELVERGHEVVILHADCESTVGRTNPLVKFYPSDQFWTDTMAGKLQQDKSDDVIETLREGLIDHCDYLLNSSKLLHELKDFDLVVGEAAFLCSPILAEKLKLPYVSVLTASLNFHFVRFMGHHSSLSFIPQFMSALPNKMSYLQRVENTLRWITGSFLVKVYLYDAHSTLIKKYNISEKSFEELIRKTKLMLAQCDFALDLAEPLPPTIKMIGPVLPQPASPLPSELEVFMSQATEGVVVVSFGSMEDLIRDDEIQAKLTHAFKRLPYKVVWKTELNGTLAISDNVKWLPWLPQNDVLGHPNTKAFVTHAGHNGMYEAAYHGVPVVACPFFYDQFDNSMRLVEREIGIEVDIEKQSGDELYDALMEIIGNQKYRENAQHASLIMKTRVRSPRQEAADWIEHVLVVKEMSHLRPHGSSMPIYQQYLIDVVVFLCLCIILALLAVWFILKGLRYVMGMFITGKALKLKTK